MLYFVWCYRYRIEKSILKNYYYVVKLSQIKKKKKKIILLWENSLNGEILTIFAI
jgi:hypothetical protein